MTTTTTVTEIIDADERHARATWSYITEPGDGHAGALVQKLGHIDALAALHGNLTDLNTITPGLATHAARWIPRLRDDAITDTLRTAHNQGIHLVDPATVPDLTDLGPHAPHVLWVRGDINALAAERRLTLTGARAATPYGEAITAEIARDLVDAGITLHGGLGYGIDGAMHRTVLDSSGGTVAWLAGGVDRTYPAGHAHLGNRIAETAGCALASQVPVGAAPTKWRFLQRNALMAAATQATVIVEAGAQSGTLNTAGHAAALGRRIGAVPGNVTSAASAGCHRLLREFDATAITSGADALELLSN